MDPSSSPTNPTPFIISSILGTIDTNGVLKVPFFTEATPAGGVPKDISFQYSGGSTLEDFDNTCGLPSNSRLVIDPIPTVGQWSVMILGILLLILGIVGYRYRVGQLKARKVQP